MNGSFDSNDRSVWFFGLMTREQAVSKLQVSSQPIKTLYLIFFRVKVLERFLFAVPRATHQTIMFYQLQKPEKLQIILFTKNKIIIKLEIKYFLMCHRLVFFSYIYSQSACSGSNLIRPKILFRPGPWIPDPIANGRIFSY